MAKASFEKRLNINLELTEQEARFVMGIMQNPLFCAPQDEDPHDRKHRIDIFNAIDFALNESKH